MPGLKIFEAIDQMPEMVDPQTGLIKPKAVDLSVSENQNFNNENVSHVRYDKGFLFDKAKDLQDENIALGSDPEAVNETLASRQSNLGATKNALIKFVGKTAITVGDTLGGLVYIPSAIVNGDLSKMYDNDFHRWMDKQSKNLDSALPIYQTKVQEQEGFFSKLNNAQFWGDGVLGGMSFSVGAVLSEMALSFLTASTFGATAELQAAETASLMSRAKKIFSAFRGEASAAELKALSKDIVKSGVVGGGYEAGVEARNFLDTARKNYIEQYKQQYGVEPNAQQLAEADGEIKKTANLIFGANMALLSVDNFIQFKNIFGKGLSTDLKLFGKSAVDTEAKDLAKDYALRGTLNAAFENTSKLRKTLYTTSKVLKNPLLEYNEEGSQGEFQAIGQDYIKKKFNATAYDDSFNLIDSFSKNFKDTYGSEDAGIGFIIGALGIPGMGIATGKTKNVKGFGNKLIASFEGGIAEAFEEQNAEKTAIKTAINQSSKVNIDNVQEQVKSNSAIYTSNKLRDEALENGDFFEAKNHESDALFSFVKSRDNVGLLNESKEQYATMIKEMDTADFAKQFGYDKIGDGEVSLSKPQLEERKNKVIEQFNKKIDNFQETKELASKVAPVRNFNDKDARLFNEAIHHLMYTTNDLDSREDSLVKTINDKLSKSKNDSINNDKLKELMSFHNTWFNLSSGKLSKELNEYNKNLNILKEEALIDVPTEEGLNSKKSKAEAKIKALKDVIETKLNEINNSKDKLSKLGFNINNNFENVDNFTQAHNEFKELQKNIENHLGQNVFDKDTIKQSIDDLAKIQSRRKDLIGTYNELNTKNGREKFDKEVKKNERKAKIDFLKERAKEFLHNQGLELDNDTIKEIENNVDLQVKEDDSPEVKAQKQTIKNYSDNIDSQNDVTELTNLVEYLRQFKEGVDDSLKTNVNTLIAKAIQKIKDLKQTKDASEKQKIEDGKRPYFSNINELFSLFNNEQQKNKLASIANNPNEKDLRSRITFTLTDLENPKSIEEAVEELKLPKNKDKNQNVISLSGVRGNNKPFNFQMKVDGELIGGFQMPNQLYLKINNKWNPIDFSKLKEDGYLTTVLEMLFPSDLISTTEDRKVLGQYLTELNSFSNKLSTITQRGDISFEDFNNLTSGQINLNAFASQIEMNFTDDKDKDGNIIETRIEDTLDDPDNVLTKAATKTIKVNGEDKNIVIFGKSTGDGQGFSKLYFVNIINGKLERNEDGSVLWRDRDDKENSEERKAIQNLVSYKKENAISTKGSLFSLLVFNSIGYIQPIFTSNETISKLKGLDNNEEFIVNFLNNEKALLPALQIISEGLSSYYEEYKDKSRDEITFEDIKNFDLFLSVTGLNKTEKVKVIPFISTYSDKIGQLSFNLEINKKDNTISSSIYFDGQNFFKSFAKGKEELDPINKRFEKGEITLAQKIEEIKKFRHEVLNENKLNEEIASLILKDTQYSVLGKLRKATNVNATINGFYTNVLLNKNNQQSLENLVTKKKLGYNLYLRPDKTQVKEITSIRKNIEIRNEQQQKAKEQVQNKEQEDLFNENTVKLEAQEEAKTIQEINANAPIADVTNANTAALFNLDDYTNEQLIAAYTKANGNTPPNNPSNLRNWLSTEANQKLKLYKNTISNLSELIQQQPAKTEVQDTSIEAKKVDITIPELTTIKVDLKSLTIDELQNVIKQVRQKAVNARDAEKQGKSVLGGSQSIENDYQALKVYITELAALESTELTPAEAKKANIERRRQEELEKPYKTVNDGSGKMATVTIKTTEKEGVKSIKFQTHTTNSKGESRTINDKGYNTFEEAVENLKIDLDSEGNETALEFVSALKETNSGKASARVTKIREGTDKSSPFYGKRVATVIVNGEAIDFTLKNDAELAALEPTKKQTPNIDKLEELGVNFEQLPKEEDLLSRVYRRSKISEKGLSLEEFVKIVTDAQNEAETEGANKLLELSTQDLEEYNIAVKNLVQILPMKTQDNPNGLFEVTDVLDMLKNLKTKGEVGGRFISKLRTIYLRTYNGKSIKNIEYHEAFHAVFRILLTDSQISKYLKAAEELYGTPTSEQLEELRNSSSDLINLSKTELKNLYLEEKMADAFMEHKTVPQSWLARLFNKIKAFINGIFGVNQDTQLSNENAITQLFNDIYQGKFKNAKEKFPVIRNVDNVNKLLVQEYKLKLTNGKYIDKKGYLSYSISEAIINTITNETAKILKDKGSKTITDDEISDIYDLFKERFNPDNEVISDLIDSIENDDLANKTASKYLNVYKSLGNLKNQEIVVQEVLERLPLYNLVNESSILQEQVDDSDDLEDDELNDTGIVQKSKNEINHAWDKASKKVKQYISSVSTNIDLFGIGKPFDDYIVNDKSKNYSFAINGNHLYSNLTKMLVGAPAYKHLSLLHSVSNTSPEIKAFAHQWYKDIYSELKKNNTLELPEINVEDFAKLYEILSPLYYKVLTSSPTFSFISSDFEKNRTYLQDVLFSKEGVTRMLNANNRNVGKQVFSKWERNWNSKRIDNLEQAKIDFKENLYESNIDNILQKYVDLLENKKGLTSQNKSNAVISLVKTFKNSFADLGIELPEQFIKYNLINFVFETGNTTLLTNEEIEWYNSFSASDIKPINLEFLDGIEKTLTTGISFGTNTIYNDIDPITQQAESLLGAVGKLMDIAESTALFDTSIIPSSFNNQEGKRIFDITPPSDISRRLNILKDKDNVQLIKEYLQTRNVQEFKDKVLNNEENGTYYLYSFFTEEYQVDNFLQALGHNPLFNDTDIDTLFTTLTMAYAGGIRQEETNVTEYEDSEDVDVSSKNYGLFSDSDGKSYNNADTTAKILYRLSLLADSKFNKYNLKVIGKQKYAYYIASQYEGKSTVPMVLLPFNNFIEKGKINEKGLNSLYSIYNQEVERIKVVQNEIDTYYLGSKKDGYNEGFHYILQDVGVKGTNGNKSVKIFTHSDGTYFYLDIDNNNNVVNLSKEELYYNEKQEDGSTIKKEINLNSLTPKGLKLFNFANKNAKLNEKDLSEEEVKQRLSNFIDFQVDEYIKLLEDKGLLKEGEINLLPKSFISGNQLNKNVLKNAFLNDYLMSYSINSLLYGDNAESTKNSNDFVKRAGGMIGSGPNYGSGKTNIILLRSEVINKIDTTDAQTFNTPFHHLSVILNSKSIDNRIKEIYQGIDSGLNYYISKEIETDIYGNKVEVEKMKKITKEDYDYLYDNNAQHQPNKTQGFGIDWFLKTSISPILRETTSTLKNYSKENLKEALLLHKELFDLKLQALPSDNAYITFLTKKYQNLFKAIKGKEYKHNLLNSLELNNAIAVYDSAWKRSKYNVHENSNGQPFLYKDNNGKKVISLISVPNASLIDQQKTDGVKKQITHPTQFLRLISTEQINETLVYFKNKEINVGTALNVYEKQLAERTDKGFKALKKEVLDENGDAEWDLLLKSFIDSIEKSSADPQQLELFQQGNSSKPKYNLNNPAIETKFQSMFLSFVSSNTLKQKVTGSKLSLKSSIGHELEREIDNEGNVIKTFTTEQSKRDTSIREANRVSQRLTHDVYDKVKHEYYSEIVVSERFLRKFGFTAEQFHKGEIPEEFLYISGVRIPTEDKHSMVNCKIVDILPDSYGNVVMLPNEIVELSGADFDIDALYVRVNQTYTNVLNKKTGIYSSYLTQPTLEESKEKAYDEYLADAYDSNKVSSTFNDLKTNNEELKRLNYEKNNLNQEKIKINDEIKNDHLFYNKNSFIETPSERLKSISNKLLETLDKIKNLELTLLEQSFDINKIIFNKEKWLENNSKLIENNYNAYQSGDIGNINPLTKGETNNMLLELERKLINNLGNNKITNTPTSLKLFKDLIETLEGEGLINKDLGYGVHDMLSKTLADISISTGAANIGPVALFNNLFGILVKNKVTIERKVGEEINLELFVNYSRDENNKLVDEKDAQRVQDSIATLLAAMTDNAKEQMANLFNLTTETLPVALAMIGVGHNFNNVMLLMKSPIVKKISELSQSYNKTIQSKQDYDDSKGNRELQKKVESIFQLEGESEFKGELTYDVLLKSLKYWNAKPEVEVEESSTIENVVQKSENKLPLNVELINTVLQFLGDRKIKLSKPIPYIKTGEDGSKLKARIGDIITDFRKIDPNSFKGIISDDDITELEKLKPLFDDFNSLNIDISSSTTRTEEVIRKYAEVSNKIRGIIYSILNPYLKEKFDTELIDSDLSKVNTEELKKLSEVRNELSKTPVIETKTTNDIKNHSMSYKMTASENLTGKDTSTIDLINEGLRTATTRSYPLGKVGDIITFENQSQQYRITDIEQLTEENVKDENWIKNWSEKEQWTEDHFKSVLGGKTVHIGSWQTTFEKVEQASTIETKTTNDGKTGIKKIISGGQTGGDLGGLEGAKLLNIETGGTAPPNFISGNKSKKELLQGYGLIEGEQDPTIYTKRTMKNVDDSDGTVAILWGSSVGTGKTIGYAQTKKWQYGDNKSKNNGYKPVLVITSKDVNIAAQELKDFVLKNNIQTLNIAGHRETSQKGIQEFTRKVIQKAFEDNDINKPVRNKPGQLDLFDKPTSNNNQSILKRISNEYFHYKKASNVFSNLQNLLQLIKGFKSTFAESEKFITALNNLGWSVSENGLDIVKNDKPTDKFYNNYKDTTKIIGNGVSDIFEKDKFLKQSIKTALALTKLSEKYFISQSPTAKKTREDILTLFKDYKAGNVDFQSNLRKHYLSYLTVMAYAESVKNSDDKLPKIEEFLLTPLEEISKDSTKENNELQNIFLQIIDHNYKNGIKNEFLEFLEIKNIDYLKKQANKNTLFGYRFHGFAANSRSLKNPDIISSIISSFNDLYFAENNNILERDPEIRRINTLKTKFAKDMFKYLVVKDGLMFQNQSFIKAIDPILFTETSNALDKVQELFSKMSSSKEYIETFGMSKEELNLDFIIKFGLNQNNYFDLKSQKIDVLRKTISSEWIKDNKIESEDFVDDNESDTNEKEELVLEDNYPIFFDSKNNTLVVNQFARITKGMKPEEKSRIKKENKKFILRDEIVIFKKIAKTYKSDDKIIPYSKIGFPIITYLSGKDSARIPLKLTAVQDSIQVDGSWINFQISPEGKVLELSNSSKESLKGDIYYGDLFNNTIYEIINNDAKLKTYKNGRERLVNIAKAIANQFENGYIEGTKALYNQHIILGSGEISSLTNSIKDQLDMVLSPEQTEKVKMNMFNKTKEKAKDETEVRLNFINLINQYSAITKVTLEGTKNKTIEDLERVANNFMVKAGKSKQEIEEKIKKCYSKS